LVAQDAATIFLLRLARESIFCRMPDHLMIPFKSILPNQRAQRFPGLDPTIILAISIPGRFRDYSQKPCAF
jgi:hypothetical protein